MIFFKIIMLCERDRRSGRRAGAAAGAARRASEIETVDRVNQPGAAP